MTDSETGVHIWEEDVVIPTYGVGEPNKNPMFLEKRVYQGSSGVVYPYPVIDSISDEKEDRTWRAVYLENEYLKVMVLPELGGRVQMALDKTNGYHFVYHNRVIKPALVGLAGPWISGGIEFNWPQHHRPSTYLPTEYTITGNADGSKTLWVAETERMSRMRSRIGFTLHPHRAVLELRVHLYNGTPEPKTFLWWANPAVAVNGDYQSVFPPDVHAVMDHGKRDVSTFPIATGTYYKVDYSPGTDISRYKNIPVPTSYMAYHSDYDFVGGYDHGRRAGLLHVADHHVSPGKKQWTWGCGDFGRRWDRHLTDEDGPYFELMCGVFTDNQPDFSWLMPFEEKSFVQNFLPYKDIGVVKNASAAAAISLDVRDGKAVLGVYVTSPDDLTIRLTDGGETVYEESLVLTPARALTAEVAVSGPPEAVRLALLDLDGREFLAYQPAPEAAPDIPAPAEAALPPEEIATVEELYLTGLHLEQYRHATYRPEDYYGEALRRDPGDARSNTAMGRLLYRQGRFAEAEAHFRRAIARLTRRNPNPYDGEAFYHLGLALRMQGRHEEAYDAFYKATWNAAWQAAGFFAMARLASGSRLHEALEFVGRSLERNARNHKARHLLIALRRRLGRGADAEAAANRALALDPLNAGALYSRTLLSPDPERREQFERVMRGDIGNYIELALDYHRAGLLHEARDVLQHGLDTGATRPPGGYRDPMAVYLLGWFAWEAGDANTARARFREASALPPDYGFPNRLEDMLALEAALKANPEDARAWYYLGNFYYGVRRHEDAIAAWERARDLDPGFPTARRNLALAYVNVRGEEEAAWRELEAAFNADPSDARVLYEWDQLAKRMNHDAAGRLARLEAYPALVDARDDLNIEHVTLLNRLGRHEDALARLARRSFHPWEGGEGKVTGQYALALVEFAKNALSDGRPEEAIQRLEQAMTYPENLGEGKLAGATENDIHYWLGMARRAMGDEAAARAAFDLATRGDAEPASALYYYDQPPDRIFYQGLALRALGREDEARARFQRLLDYGEAHMDDDVRIDYFAVSLPDFLVFEDDLNRRNRVHCHYLIGLGALGLGDTAHAIKAFDAALALDENHMGAATHRSVGH